MTNSQFIFFPKIPAVIYYQIFFAVFTIPNFGESIVSESGRLLFLPLSYRFFLDWSGCRGTVPDGFEGSRLSRPETLPHSCDSKAGPHFDPHCFLLGSIPNCHWASGAASPFKCPPKCPLLSSRGLMNELQYVQ